MAMSEKPLRERLINAYSYHLSHADGPIYKWGQDIQEKLDELRSELTKVPHDTDGSIKATVEQMTDDEVAAAIEKICGIIFDLKVPSK